MTAFIIKFLENWIGFIERNFIIFLKNRVKLFLVLVRFFRSRENSRAKYFYFRIPRVMDVSWMTKLKCALHNEYNSFYHFYYVDKAFVQLQKRSLNEEKGSD